MTQSWDLPFQNPELSLRVTRAQCTGQSLFWDKSEPYMHPLHRNSCMRSAWCLSDFMLSFLVLSGQYQLHPVTILGKKDLEALRRMPHADLHSSLYNPCWHTTCLFFFFLFQRVDKEESWICISRAKSDEMLVLTKSVSNSSIMTPSPCKANTDRGLA